MSKFELDKKIAFIEIQCDSAICGYRIGSWAGVEAPV